MANEYLKRTPTSTGNRKVWTYSVWFKLNDNTPTDGWAWLYNTSVNGAIMINFDAPTYKSFVQFYDNGGSQQVFSKASFRDPSAWYHLVVSYNSTLSEETDRVKLFMNGVRLETNSSLSNIYPSQNLESNWNDDIVHSMGRWEHGASRYIKAQYSDQFLLDGQALTPDVFGFYKDGDGYMSSGTSDATDFRPGQWSPHSPRKIKTEIERKGGFGVNGFYLPMNDSSNVGADFHTTPNSIITLKGEDLPQPRNGAPTTTDAYVSQLREETGSLGFDGVVKFDGIGDYLTIADNSDFAFGTGDFTVEAFVFATELGTYNTIFDTSSTGQDTTGIRLGVQSNGQLYLYTNGFFLTADNAISTGRWYHVAYVRNSGTHRLFVNGVQLDSTSTARDYTNDSCTIGSHFAFGESWEGFISNLRVVKGTAVYTSNFTAPTEPLANITNTKLLCCNSSTSATAATVSPGTITANGNAFATRNELSGSIVLAVPGISTSTSANLVTNGTFDTNTTGWTAGNSATLSVDAGRLKVTNGTSSAGYAYQAITVEVGKRYTVNLEGITGTSASNTRIGTAVNAADYGNKIGSGLVNISLTATSTTLYVTLKPNSNTNGNNAFFDNVVVKQEDAPRDYSADIKGSGSNKTLTPNGQAGVGYELGGYYGSSMKFDGAGDYLETTLSAFGTSDFTIEYWINPNSISASYTGTVRLQATTTAKRIEQAFQSSTLQIYTDSGAWRDTGFAPPTNQWTHIALEKYNGYLTLYANGVAVWTVTNTRDYDESFNVDIGNHVNSLNGYMQDVRVYSGAAKYKGGFDVPKPYTPVGIESWRQVPDTCKNNFATWNPLLGPQGCALANGNLTVTSDGANNHKGTRSTMGMSSGKWYWEYRVGTVAVNSYVGVSADMTPDGLSGPNYIVSGQGGNNYVSPNGSFSVTDSSMTTGMIIGCAFDRDASTQQLKVYKNGSLAVTGTSSDLGDGVIYLAHNSFNAAASDGWEANFGQNPTFSGTTTAGTYTDSNGRGLFKYQPPAGYLALCEDNLPAPAIADPGEHFKCVLYTGTGSSRAVTGVGFKPDFVWIKNRDSTYQHQVYDSVRGAGQKLLPSTTNAETTDTANVSSFDSNGFSFAGGNVGVNQDTKNHVAWCWKAGGAPVANTDGALTSQVSVNQDAGFSIATYTTPGTATNFGHGLGKKPAFALFKARNDTGNWAVYHQSLGTNTIRLSTDGAQDTSSDAFNGTAPTDTLMYLGTWAGTNNPNINWVSYLWAEIEGYSKFGSYEGSGNADGPFVYCGFKPAWVMAKNIDDTGGRDWGIQDSSRQPINPCDKQLKANKNDVENSGIAGSTFQIDMLSNGFKVRNNTGIWNNSGQTIIFMAFAESPFQTANAK